jgi:hypothetical protein
MIAKVKLIKVDEQERKRRREKILKALLKNTHV